MDYIITHIFVIYFFSNVFAIYIFASPSESPCFPLFSESVRAPLKLRHLAHLCPCQGSKSRTVRFLFFLRVFLSVAAKVHQSDLRAYSHEGESLIVSGSECYWGGRNCRALSAGQRQAVRSGREWESGRRAACRVDVMFMWWPVQPFPPPPAPADGRSQRALMQHTGQRGHRLSAGQCVSHCHAASQSQ